MNDINMLFNRIVFIPLKSLVSLYIIPLLVLHIL